MKNGLILLLVVIFLGCESHNEREGGISDSEGINLVLPLNGFETVNTSDLSYSKAWNAVQELMVVRNYLSKNPDQKVKVLFYQPSVGLGNPKDWKWIFFLKK